MKIEEKLRENAELYPDSVALNCGESVVSYSELYDSVCRRAASSGYLQGKPVLVEATPTVDFIVTYFAIHQAGAVAVPVRKSMPVQAKKELTGIFEGKSAPEEVADILYTTGTTGKSKVVMVSHDAIFAEAENLVEAQKFSRDTTFIINGPLNHIGSLSKIYPTVYVGGTVHIIDGMKDISAFFNAVETAPGKVATFLVPATIRMLVAFAKDRLASCADKIDFIETGAAPMAQSDMEMLCRILPHTRLYNTYASTETGIISTFDYNAGECIAGCLGVPMKHSSFFITDEGTVACKGKTLMSGYWNEQEATDRILRDGTIFTNDIGTVDAMGRLHLQGRKDNVINVGGYKVAPAEVENVVLLFPRVKDCVCVASSHPIMGKVLKLLVVPGEGYERKELVAFLKSRLEPHKIPVQYEEVDMIQRTFNGKIDRKMYAQ